MKNKSSVIVFAVFALVVILSIFAYYSQKEKNQIIGDKIYNELLKPYKEALVAKDYNTAYSKFTSNDYKKKYTLARFVTVQDSNLTVYGKIIDMTPITGIFVKENSPNGFSIFKGTIIYSAENNSRKIVIEVTFENDSMKINRTYDSYLTIGNIIPVIY